MHVRQAVMMIFGPEVEKTRAGKFVALHTVKGSRDAARYPRTGWILWSRVMPQPGVTQRKELVVPIKQPAARTQGQSGHFEQGENF